MEDRVRTHRRSVTRLLLFLRSFEGVRAAQVREQSVQF
jgi:hypothetical protein